MVEPRCISESVPEFPNWPLGDDLKTRHEASLGKHIITTRPPEKIIIIRGQEICPEKHVRAQTVTHNASNLHLSYQC